MELFYRQARACCHVEAEKNGTHAASAFDVMIGIQRVPEGTDRPLCSPVYRVGMPGSLNTLVQFLGRAMRPKADDYPAPHRDRGRLVFFVPCAGGTALSCATGVVVVILLVFRAFLANMAKPD